jgi:putative two-component system response regulator
MENDKATNARENHAMMHKTVYESSGDSMSSNRKVFVVDDQEYILPVLKATLEESGYNVEVFVSGKDVLHELEKNSAPPCLIITDMVMPGMSGIEMAAEIRKKYPDVPIIAITGFFDEVMFKGLYEQGFSDVIIKPVKSAVFIKKVKMVLEHAQIPTYRKLNDALVKTIANMGDARDSLTQYHNLRLGEICAAVAREMKLSAEFIENIRLAARMHDIGKLGIRDAVLQKQGKLSNEEFEHIKTHSLLGTEILLPLLDILSMDYLWMAYEIAFMHHERMDGSGYPAGLIGAAIPMHARIAAVADVYDACTMKRPYHEGRPHEFGIKVISEEAQQGKLDERVVRAFVNISSEIKGIKDRFP